jgi:hypothetical protein
LGSGPLVLLESDVGWESTLSLKLRLSTSLLSSKMDDVAEEDLWLWLLSPDFFLKKK